MDSCAAPLRDRLTASLRSQLAADMIARRELQALLAAWRTAGVHTLLFKGAALAFTHYPDPVLRPRGDTDVLIDATNRHTASEVLTRQGYERLPLVSGDLVMHQAAYAKTDTAGVRHLIDLHWKVVNPQVFARALGWRDLLASAVHIPELGEMARAPAPVHALALACVHRVAHHSNEERLIWIYDIHLLAERLTEAERGDFLDFAAERELTAVCIQGLGRAQQLFPGPSMSLLLARLRACRPLIAESSHRFITPMRKVDVLISDLKALNGWGLRVKLLREHVFPPRAYMREAFGEMSAAPLPLLYAWRFVRGAARWCRWPDKTAPNRQ